MKATLTMVFRKFLRRLQGSLTHKSMSVLNGDWDEIFICTGQPCDAVRLAEIERRIGFELPETYRQVIMACGGGSFHEEIGRIREDDELGCMVKTLYGNGQPTDEYDEHSLDELCLRLMKTWDMPSWGFFIGEAEGEIHTPILLNLSNPMYPPGALVCVDLEVEEEVLIAESFDALWEVIQRNVEKARLVEPDPERRAADRPFAKYVVFFDPVDDALFLPTLQGRCADGVPSDKLLEFVTSRGLRPELVGDGIVGVDAADPIAVARDVFDDAVAAGIGIAIPKFNLVVWRGETPVPVGVNTLRWANDKPVSFGLVQDLLWQSQFSRTHFHDCPVVFVDQSDPSGMTYLQALYNRAFSNWAVEYQMGSTDNRYWLEISGHNSKAAALKSVAELVCYWIKHGSEIRSYAEWEKDTYGTENPNDLCRGYYSRTRGKIDSVTKQFQVFDVDDEDNWVPPETNTT